MLARKGDPTCVKMIDFGLSKDFSGQSTMKTMSGSVSCKQRTNAKPADNPAFNLSLVVILAVLHRARSVLAELQLEDRHLVNGSRSVHHAFRQGALPGQLRAGNYWQRHQRRLPFQPRAFLKAFT